MGDWNAETAEWYAEKYGEYATNRLAVDALTLPADSVIVDVGCGTGAALRHAAPRIPEGTLIGVDPVPRMIEIAKERANEHPEGHRIDFRVGPAEALPVDAGIADFVFAFDSLDHWSDVGRGLLEIHRVLKPAGTLVVVKDGEVPGAGKARESFLRLVEKAGFSVVEEKGIEADGVLFSLWCCRPKR